MCKIVIEKLILSPINSLDGISIVIQQSMGNPIMLNVNKSATYQQYYGVNINKTQGNVVRRVTYGYNKDRNREGTE